MRIGAWVLAFAALTSACTPASDVPDATQPKTLQALAETLTAALGQREQAEDCSAGRVLIDYQHEQLIGPLGVCKIDLGDTIFYTYSGTDGHFRVVGQHYYVPRVRLAHAADSVIAELSRVYGRGEECPADPLGGPYIARYHRWSAGTYDIQMIANSMELEGQWPAIGIEAQNIASVCGQWSGMPYERPPQN